MKAIPTLYRGNVYRSRLEARWAAFFDVIGWCYTYEPFDTNGYIPDFLIHGDRPLLVEVKPAVTRGDFLDPIPKVEAGLAGHWKGDYLIVGASPVSLLNNTFDGDYPAAGLLGEFYADNDLHDPEWSIGVGLWHDCLKCLEINVFHDTDYYMGRPCGHADGDHYLGHIKRGRQAIEDMWSTASSITQWKAS
jgi:hypothetical protein